MSVVSRDIGHDGISSLRRGGGVGGWGGEEEWIISSNYSLLLGTGPLVCQ